MNLRARVAAGLVLTFGLLLLIPEAWFSPRLQVSVAAASAGLGLAVVALASSRYRLGRDPHALFLAVGFGVVAVQAIVFGVWWPIHHEEGAMFAITVGTSTAAYDPVRSLSGAAPVYAMQLGWLVAAICFLLGVPWWDRRGRPAIRAWRVVVPVVAILLIADRYLAVAYLRPPGPGTIFPVRVRIHPETLGWILGITAATVLVAAAWRELFRRRDPPHPWLGIAFAAAVALPLSAIRWPTQGLAYVQWSDVLQVVVPAIAIGALLFAQHGETSRMRRASDLADEVLGGRAEIASVIAHDVRGPVSAIKSIAASTIANYDRLDDAQRLEFVGLIDQQALHVLGVVHQMSVALRVDAGALELVRTRTDIAAVVQIAKGDALIQGHPVLVDDAEGVDGVVDTKWLAEAIRQGLDNAARFSPPGAPVHVALGATDDGWLRIEITDAGPGIPASRREDVFQRFARWRPPGYQDVPGSGLGLFICRGIVREHGGEATLDAAPRGGTILRIKLPGSAS